MKILHWTDCYYPGPHLGGAPLFVSNLSQEQRNNGHEVMVVTEQVEDWNDHDNYDGVDVYRFPFTMAALDGNLKEMHRLSIAGAAIKNKLQPDIIHVHLNQVTAWFDVLSKSRAKFPSIVTVHPPIGMTSLPETMVRRILAENDIIVAVSRSQKNDIDHFLGDDSKTRVIHNGIPPIATQVLPLPFKPAVVLCIGRLHKTKGFDVALKACAKVLAERPGSIKVIIAGNGPERENLQDLSEEFGTAAELFEFRGWVDPDEVAVILNQGTIVLMPSVWDEPFGLVAAQAAQMGRPVIGSNIGGIPEVVVDKKTGLLVQPGNVDELADAMLFLLTNAEFTITLGENARKIAKDRFSMAACAANYQSIYENLLCGEKLC